MANERQRGNEISSTGVTVAFNIRRLRTASGLDLRALSRLLTERGRPISASALSKIENLERRVDVDDLVAIALVLEANPDALLFPPTIVGGLFFDLTGAPSQPSEQVWAWARGDAPLSLPHAPGRPTNGEQSFAEREQAWKAAFAAEADKFVARVRPGAPANPGPGVAYLKKSAAEDEVLDWVHVDGGGEGAS